MRARGVLLALWTVAAAMRAEGQTPDWFDAFRGRAYLQGDASFVAREKSAAPDSPPLFRARWVVLRYAGFAESERRWWPYRNVLLVTTPSGARYVLESSLGFVDEKHLDEERPWQRVASGRAAFEVWMSGTAGEPGTAADPAPCEGMRQTVRAPGGTLVFFLDELGTPTVRTTLGEIARRPSTRASGGISRCSSARPSRATGRSRRRATVLGLRDPLLAATVALRDRLPRADQRTLVLAPDSEPGGRPRRLARPRPPAARPPAVPGAAAGEADPMKSKSSRLLFTF